MKITGQVPRLHNLDEEVFSRRFLEPQRPVIITGAASNWSAFRTWNQEYLKERIGQKRVHIKKSSGHRHPDLFSGQPTGQVEWLMSDYIDLLASSRADKAHYYLSGDEVQILSNYGNRDRDLSILFDDCGVPKYCPVEALKTIGLWISAKGVQAALHYDSDGCHNLNVQVKGSKRVLLFHPSQQMYPFSGYGTSRGKANFSQIDIGAPDFARFPAFRTAKCEEAILQEGDMLFIPSFWFHALYHLGELNVNVNFWWQPERLLLNKTSFRSVLLDLSTRTLSGKLMPSASEIAGSWLEQPSEKRELLLEMERTIAQLYKL